MTKLPLRRTGSRLPLHYLLLAALLPLLLPACSGTGDKAGEDPYGSGYNSDQVDISSLPRRNEGVSLYGPGSEGVRRDLFSPVYFAFDSTTISGAEMSKIDAVAQYMNGQGARSSIIVGGFTDSVGTEEYNRQLGEFRALAVRSELLGRGIPSDRIQTVSFGEDMPASPGDHAANRRCEFGIVE